VGIDQRDDALTAAYRAHARDLTRVAWLLTGSAAAAEDAVHEVFLRCAGRIEGLDHPASYLRASVVNECRRQHKRRVRAEAAGEPPPAVSLPDELVELQDALAGLSERQRAVIVLRYLVDLPEQEIADALGCRPSTVRSLNRRALARLREVLP
jgi:RNA polymerase sigma factor (sigma-70 family)